MTKLKESPNHRYAARIITEQAAQVRRDTTLVSPSAIAGSRASIRVMTWGSGAIERASTADVAEVMIA